MGADGSVTAEDCWLVHSAVGLPELWGALGSAGPGASPCASREEAGNVTGSSVELNTWKIWGFIEILLEEGNKNPSPLERKYILHYFPCQIKDLSVLKPNVLSNKTC